jgi:hypothetical protein
MNLSRRKPPTRLSRKSLTAFLGSLAVLGLCAFQFGDRNGLNNLPFSQVQTLVSDSPHAKRMAQQGNIEFLAGQPVPGKTVQLRGELTDANCYLASHNHAYDHAFCAKFCVAAGSPLLFISDQGNQMYVVLTAQNGIKLPENVLDRIGVPGILITGTVLDTEGLHALAIQAVQH